MSFFRNRRNLMSLFAPKNTKYETSNDDNARVFLLSNKCDNMSRAWYFSYEFYETKFRIEFSDCRSLFNARRLVFGGRNLENRRRGRAIVGSKAGSKK